jgi:hypothetical protein
MLEAERGSRTAAACSRESCEGCPLEGRLLCLHTRRDLFDFGVLAVGFFIPFVAGMVIGGYWLALGVWLVLAGVFFGYVEALVLCRHCPHYAEEGFFLRCHANYGLPKIPGYSPRPLTRGEEIVFFVYVGVLGLYYVPFFVLSRQWLLLLIASWALVTWAWTLLRTQCTRCYHVFCPLNRVPEEVREEFFEHYPAFARARRLSLDGMEQHAKGGGGHDDE